MKENFFERTSYEALLDIDYAIRFHRMNARFYSRLDKAFSILTLLGGSAVVVGVLSRFETVSLAAALIMAAAAIIEHVICPIKCSLEHKSAAQDFALLKSRAAKYDLNKIDAELVCMQNSAPDGLSSLEIPAYNANLLSNGRGDFLVKESLLAHLIKHLA